MTCREIILPKREFSAIDTDLSSMIAIQAMQVPRWSGGLLHVPSSEVLVHSKK
jgi:hypothetical protein